LWHVFSSKLELETDAPTKSQSPTKNSGNGAWWLKDIPYWLPPPPEWGPLPEWMFRSYFLSPGTGNPPFYPQGGDLPPRVLSSEWMLGGGDKSAVGVGGGVVGVGGVQSEGGSMWTQVPIDWSQSLGFLPYPYASVPPIRPPPSPIWTGYSSYLEGQSSTPSHTSGTTNPKNEILSEPYKENKKKNQHLLTPLSLITPTTTTKSFDSNMKETGLTHNGDYNEKHQQQPSHSYLVNTKKRGMESLPSVTNYHPRFLDQVFSGGYKDIKDLTHFDGEKNSEI